MYCWKCGSQIREGSAFCPMCGVVQNAEVKGPKVNLEFGFDDGSSKKNEKPQADAAPEAQVNEKPRPQNPAGTDNSDSVTQASWQGNTSNPGVDAYRQGTQKPAADPYRGSTANPGADTYNSSTSGPAWDDYQDDYQDDDQADYQRESAGRAGSRRQTAYEQAQRSRQQRAPREPRATREPRTPRPPRQGGNDASFIKYIEMGASVIGFVFLIPFIFGILRNIFRWLGYNLYARAIWNFGNFFGMIATILVWIILIASIAVLAGLIYLLVAKRGQDLIPLVTGIVAAGLVFITSILYLTHVVFVLRVILILAAAVLCLDLFVKVFLEKRGLTGSFNLADDFAMLKESFKSADEPVEPQRYTDPNIPQYAATPEIESGESYFDGKGVELFGMQILLSLVSVVTCSLATPWILVKKIKWETSHTVIEGKRQSFNGTATELFGHWIKWFLLSLVTCGLYLYYAHIDYMKWLTKHTTYVGMEMPDGNEYRNSYFDGSFAEYIGTGVLSGILTTVTCGIGYPWAFTMQQKYDIKSTVVCGDRYFYDGTGGGLFGVWIGNALLTMITCGIYSAWAQCALNRYFVGHTHIDAMNRPMVRR